MNYTLITGASSGIGREMAKRWAKEGHNLILVARREERLKELKDMIVQKYPVNVIIMVYDISVKEQCFELHKACSNYSIHCVINNAGGGKVGYFLDVPLEDELAMIDTNIIGLHILTKLFANSMKKGRILNVASMAGFQPNPLMTTYGATKSYVIQFSRAVNYELRRRRKPVRVSILCPGPVQTEFQELANVKEKQSTSIIGRIYKNQMIKPEKCAQVAYKGLQCNKEVIYPTKFNQILQLFSKVTPTFLLLRLQYNIQAKKIEEL